MKDADEKVYRPMSESVLEAYGKGEEDEALEPIVLEDGRGVPLGRIRKGDYVIFYDIRGEREVQLTECLTDPGFSHFETGGMKTNFVTMIEYDPKLDVKVAFPPLERLKNTLVEVVSGAGLRTVKIVETEKAVHLGHFLNGKREDPFPGEERRFIDSLKVADYAEHPEMRIHEVTKTVLGALEEKGHDLYIVNLANTDVVGHIENREAVLRAVEAVDDSIGRVVGKAREEGYDVVITADHGTVEKWYYPDGKVDTGHTDSLVPFIYIGSAGGGPDSRALLRGDGGLTDVAPTVLDLLGLEKPAEMTGTSLFDSGESPSASSPGSRGVLLLIADGWGYAEPGPRNLISCAETPNMDRYMKEYPTTLLRAAGESVGMPEGTVGNSEAGHLHIGSGRVVYSDRLRIDRAIEDGAYFRNPAFMWAMEGAGKEKKPLHLLGIVSFYSSHGSLRHLMALMKMARDLGLEEVYIHSLLGRRGERPEAGAAYIRDVEKEAERLGVGRVVTVLGRFWALDREYNWDRIEKTFKALVSGEGRRVGPAGGA